MRRALAIVLFSAACVILYYSLTMLLLVPGLPGGSYWSRERTLYGLIPAASGLGLLILVSSISLPHVTTITLLRRTCRLICLAAVCIIALWAVLILRVGI